MRLAVRMKGIVALPFLALLLLVAGLSWGISDLGLRIVQRARDERGFAIARRDATNRALLETVHTIGCRDASAAFAAFDIVRRGCALGAAPLLDIETIFTPISDCPGRLIPALPSQADANVIRAARYCELPERATLTDLRLLENILATTPIALTERAPFSMLASAGSIELHAPLVIHGDTFIVAGGEIILQELRAERDARVVAMAISGTIRVMEHSPQVFLQQLEGAYLPAQPVLPIPELARFVYQLGRADH